jgi:hypothetical protein
MLPGSAPAHRGPRTPASAFAKNAAAIQLGASRAAGPGLAPRGLDRRWNARPAMHNVLEPDPYRGSASLEYC